MPKKTTAEPKATERELLQLLERRHAGHGNGGAGEYAFLTHVRNDGGFSASRTFDAVSVALWPSRGYAIHVFEVKCSRSDWLRELKDPAKSEAAWSIGDLFSIVAPVGVVNLEELPPGWGLVEAHGAKIVDGAVTGRRLKTTKSPEWHGDTVKKSADKAVARGLLVAMLRRAGAVPDHELPSDKVINAAVATAREEAAEQWRTQLEDARRRENETRDAVRQFVNLSGVQVVPHTYGRGATQEEIDATARRIRAALADDQHAVTVQRRLERLRAELVAATEQLDRVLENPEEPAPPLRSASL